MTRPLSTKQLIARDLRPPKWVVSRPVKRETLSEIVSVANQCSLIKQGKREAQSFIRGAYYAHPSKPRESTTPVSPWRSSSNRGFRALERLIAQPRRGTP